MAGVYKGVKEKEF